MYKYILKRLLTMIPVLLGVTFIVYFILAVSPGNPALIILGDGATPDSIAKLNEELGLNDPFIVRYLRFVWNAIQGDLGTSYKNSLDVSAMVMERFPATLVLALAATLIALAIGIPVGILSAKKQYSFIDYFVTVLSMIGVSMPTFWLGLLLVMLFSLQLGWLPSQGMNTESVGMFLRSLILPAVTLGTSVTATIARMTRSSMLDVIRADYIDTARAKGLNDSIITRRHMMKNAIIPIITAIGLQFGQLLGGAMLTETIFSWPGIGRLMIDNIKTKDIPVVLGCVIFLAVMFSIVNLIVDIIYAFVDPRIKSQFQRGKQKKLVVADKTGEAAA